MNILKSVENRSKNVKAYSKVHLDILKSWITALIKNLNIYFEEWSNTYFILILIQFANESTPLMRQWLMCQTMYINNGAKRSTQCD